MKDRCLKILERLGHFQAQLLMTLMFLLIVAPYGVLLCLFGSGKLPSGRWQKVERQQSDLARLRRTF